jgi:hypothetical protein
MNALIIFSLVVIAAAIIVSGMLLFSGKRGLHMITLPVALLATAFALAGDAICIVYPGTVYTWKKAVFASESLMAVSWFVFAACFARTVQWADAGKVVRYALISAPILFALILVIPVDLFFYAPDFDKERILLLDNTGYFFNLVLLLISVASIVSLELTLRSSAGLTRWSIKYVLLSSGGIMALNIFYYSHALLYRSIDMNLLPVRLGVTLLLVLMLGYAIMRRGAMDIRISVSRKMVFSSVGLMLVGVYLLGMGLIGEGLRYLGPQTGNNLMVLAGFTGALMLLVVMLSEQVRRKVVVFFNKHFFARKYDYRQQWLDFTNRLAMKHDLDEVIHAVVDGFKQTMGVRGASIWLRNPETGVYYCALSRFDEDYSLSVDYDLVRFMEESGWVVDVKNSNCRQIIEECRDFITAARASLIVPLEGTANLAGFIVLEEGLVEEEYNYEDYDLLRTLSRQAAAVIMSARLSERLAESREMEAIGRLSSFIIHDLKNAVSRLTLVVQNAEAHMDNPEFRADAMRAVSNSAGNINRIIERLGELRRRIEPKIEPGNLNNCVKTAIEEFRDGAGIDISYTEDGDIISLFDCEEIGKVIMNLLKNAHEATESDGQIAVSVGRDGDSAYVKIRDNGCGMSDDFIRKRLFNPFQTTKRGGLGIGLYHCRKIAEAHSGRLEVESREGEGTSFTLYLPRAE